MIFYICTITSIHFLAFFMLFALQYPTYDKKILSWSKKRILTWKRLRCWFQLRFHLHLEFKVNIWVWKFLACRYLLEYCWGVGVIRLRPTPPQYSNKYRHARNFHTQILTLNSKWRRKRSWNLQRKSFQVKIRFFDQDKIF